MKFPLDNRCPSWEEYRERVEAALAIFIRLFQDYQQNSFAKWPHDYVQVHNPKTDRYVKIDRTQGRIVSHKRSPGPYKGVRIAEKREAAK
jgi:glutamate dehydrogenase/leucine dehydrogenase